MVAIRVEPTTLATRPLQTAGVGRDLPIRMFNGQMAMLDAQGASRPYLIEAIPQLNTDSWRLLPDGRMETTYKLRPNVLWQDGTPLASEDFVFGWRVYATPALGHSGLPPFNAMEEVVAPDSRTVLVRWKQAYPDVSFVASFAEFPPLPRHILSEAHRPEQLEAFTNHPYWNRDYVGLGPYRLSQWEPGAFVEGTAVDSHAWGRAKIDRVRLNFANDPNAVLARIIAGDIHLSDGSSLGLAQAAVLRKDWVASGSGNVLLQPSQWLAAHFQHRPELADPKVILNPTFRKALAHAVDKTGFNETLYDGMGIPTDSLVAPTSIWGLAADRGAAKYPFDLRRTDQLVQELGYRKGGDGVYASATDGRLTFEVKTHAGKDNEAEVAVVAGAWRQAGFDTQEFVLPATQGQDPEKRATFAGAYTNGQNCCESAIVGFTSSSIPTAETRWSGPNRTGWSNAQYDRLADVFSKTLDATERESQVTELVRLHTENIESVSLFIRPSAWVHASSLRGLVLAPPEGNMSWNLHEWTLQ